MLEVHAAELMTMKREYIDMKKIIFCLVVLPVAFWGNVINPSPAHGATYTGLFNMLAIVPGMTKTVEIRQSQVFPLGCPMFFVAVLGEGTLGLSVQKDDVAGDIIFMFGAAVSGAGTIPVYRIGQSNGMIDQIVEVEQYGFVWLWCGVAFSQNTPSYNSQLRISLEP